MKELQYFKDPGNPDISVALAGINKLEWICAEYDEVLHAAVHKMSKNKFDILPIIEKNGQVLKYYQTNRWGDYNSDNIIISEITQSDRLYYLTHIHDAIIKFAKTNRKFFFLDNQDEIIGLITIGNLNSKHVYVYLYNLVVQLEQAMGKFIYDQNVKDADLIKLFEQRKESNNSFDALARYKADDQKGLDYNFIEYIYLTDLSFIFCKYKFHELIGMTRRAFENEIVKANELRKLVAHPNKSIIRSNDSIHKLVEAIIGIDVLIESIKIK